jgi:hypothetical protein
MCRCGWDQVSRWYVRLPQSMRCAQYFRSSWGQNR